MSNIRKPVLWEETQSPVLQSSSNEYKIHNIREIGKNARRSSQADASKSWKKLKKKQNPIKIKIKLLVTAPYKP